MWALTDSTSLLSLCCLLGRTKTWSGAQGAAEGLIRAHHHQLCRHYVNVGQCVLKGRRRCRVTAGSASIPTHPL